MTELNAQYTCEGPSHFFLFHRDRQWNEQQQSWMGFERKRGKLNALNDWLRNRGNTFTTQIGQELEAMLKSAVGFNAARGDVLTLSVFPFAA